jgi:hypothetical protein
MVFRNFSLLVLLPREELEGAPPFILLGTQFFLEYKARVLLDFFSTENPSMDHSLSSLTCQGRAPRSLAGASGAQVGEHAPWREHLAQQFGVTHTRIALPEPYPTLPSD